MKNGDFPSFFVCLLCRVTLTMGFGERWVMVGPAAGSLRDDDHNEWMSPKKSKDTKVQRFQLQGGAPKRDVCWLTKPP